MIFILNKSFCFILYIFIYFYILMINKNYCYALLGASKNPEKYGYKIFNDLLEKWYSIYPVNPKWGELLGQKIFENLEELIEQIRIPDVVIFVLPPKLSLKLLEIIKKINIKKVWFQPGSYDDLCLRFCEKHGIEEVHNACMMMKG